MVSLDGKLVSLKIQETVTGEISQLKKKVGRSPGLTVVLVGEDPASKIYVKSKEKMAAKLGVESNIIRLDADIPREELIGQIHDLNNDETVDAILIQLPLPDTFDTWDILDHLSPAKDVDRFHPFNQGMVLLKRTDIFPCTPSGILQFLDHYEINVSGMNAVVIGRSFIVGKPIASMLTNRNATVTLCHSRTKNVKDILVNADLIVAATGKVGLVTEDMVKEGAVLIDVGMNYLENEEDVKNYCDESQLKRFKKRGYGITGDIHKDCFKKSSYFTPVPGGVGLMTVAMLLYNTLQLYKKNNNL
jgi:methylenetetrahydrofolate dehydrogenase (NADP+)/methenyltetrahydrofolate cyclohydrolase